MPSVKPSHRRLEASPFAWEDLTDKQRGAAEKAAQLLLEAVRALNPTAEGTRDGLSRDRRSQLAFIDGDRGMGKTSVLLSIQAVTNANFDIAKVPPDVRSIHELYRESERILWLETLDMEPLARSANLFAAILARIGEKLEPARREGGPAIAAALDDLDAREQVALELQRLQENAVLIWDGTERRRAERIDPEAYASEVLRSERAGLDLNGRLGAVLQRLAKLMASNRRGGDPIFVVPVDDFDLAPTRCQELLRIIRMITTPHLFFLIAGNSRIAEDVLRLQNHGELALLAGSILQDEELQLVRARAIEISANNMRKLVPPEQRARLEEVRVEEALQMRFASDQLTLAEELASIRFERNNAPDGDRWTTLKSFLLLDDPLLKNRSLAAAWLGGTPRQVHDRAHTLAPFRDVQADWGASLLRALSDELRREALEDWHLPPAQRQSLSKVYDTSSALRFSPARVFDATSEGEEWIRQTSFQQGSIVLSSPRALRIRLKEHLESEDRTIYFELPRRLAAGAALFHDLATSLWGGYVQDSLVYEAAELFTLVDVRWTKSKGTPASVHWYTPDWWTLREHERFAVHWTSHASRSDTPENYASAWLASQLEVLMDVEHDATPAGRNIDRLKALLSKLVAEQPERVARKSLRSSALVVLGLLLAPESGLPEPYSKKFLKMPDVKRALEDDGVAKRIRTRRAEVFAIIVRGRQEASRRDQREVIDPQAYALLTAIQPERATSLAGSKLLDELDSWEIKSESSSKMELQAALAKLRSILSSRQTLFDMPDKLVSTLREHGPSRLTARLNIVIGANKRPFADHPLNALGGGILVPSESEIEEASIGDLKLNGWP